MSHMWGKSTLSWNLWWFLTIFGSNKRLSLPPGPLIWTFMDMADLQHVLGGLIKLFEPPKMHNDSQNVEKTRWKKVEIHDISICAQFLCKNWVRLWVLYVGWVNPDPPVKKKFEHCLVSVASQPDFWRVFYDAFFAHSQGLMAVNMSLTPQGTFFKVFAHYQAIKVASRRLEPWFSRFDPKSGEKCHFHENGCFGGNFGSGNPADGSFSLR